ncbi:MAG: serine hydrolase [Fimbriimonas sp.]|nr:serine hydrolase [Fimbriimonas sp.]
MTPRHDLADLAPSVDALFAEWDKPDSPGCTVAVIRDGQVVYQKGFGMANLEYEVPNSPGTIYHVASISKQFTAFAVQLLAFEAKLSLDDEVRKHVPELHDFGYSITLRHLIHHTSGLRDQWNLLGLAGWRSGDVITEEDILRAMWRQRELNFEPGSEISYSNTGYTLLGLIVKRVSGVSLRQYCYERIFGPLGMVHTHFHDDNTEVVKGRAYSYAPTPSGFQNVPLQYANVGATSLFTTVEDMALWDRNFDTPKVGDVALLDEMHRSGTLNDGTKLDYASGLVNGSYRGLRIVGHDGADAGFRTAYRRFPDQRFATMVFANLSSFDSNLLVRKIADIFLGDLMSPAEARTSDSPSKPAEFQIDKDDLHHFVGDYYCPELSVIYSISEVDGAISMDFPKGVATLQPVGVDAFNAHPIGLVTFEREQGNITGFRLDNGRVRRLLYEVWRR